MITSKRSCNTLLTKEAVNAFRFAFKRAVIENNTSISVTLDNGTIVELIDSFEKEYFTDVLKD